MWSPWPPLFTSEVQGQILYLFNIIEHIQSYLTRYYVIVCRGFRVTMFCCTNKDREWRTGDTQPTSYTTSKGNGHQILKPPHLVSGRPHTNQWQGLSFLSSSGGRASKVRVMLYTVVPVRASVWREIHPFLHLKMILRTSSCPVYFTRCTYCWCIQ